MRGGDDKPTVPQLHLQLDSLNAIELDLVLNLVRAARTDARLWIKRDDRPVLERLEMKLELAAGQGGEHG